MDAYSVIWSPTAKLSFYKIIKYLDENWTARELNAFVKRTDEVIGLISKNPLLYPYSKENDTYKCVVVKQISVFYRIKDDYIELLVFWDNRRDPTRLRLG